MTGKRLLIHSLFLFALPVIVAWFGISVAGAIALLVLMLIWRWAISLSIMIAPAKTPELELETISASHFVEKVRWCMDRLGVEYTEKPVGGTLGAFFLGRTVPVLKFRTGAVRSSIGNSAEILRYLWGRYSTEMAEQARFLEPTPERLEFEKQVDRCGVDLQVLYPLLRFLIRNAFRITPAHYGKAVEHIEALLAEVESKLSDGRKSILGSNTINYTDLAFTAIMGLWLQPQGYGGGQADAVRIDREDCPAPMAEEIETWSTGYPLTTGFMEQLYSSERR